MACALIVLAVLRLSAASGSNTSQSETCAEHEYMSKNGFCCDRCPPGFKLKTECSGKGLRSNCEKCREGTYLDVLNYVWNCRACDTCITNEDVMSQCTREKNTVCRCKTGYYKYVINSITRMCKPCKTCSAGERVRNECNSERNTECECKDFHYRVGKSKECLPCTNCSKECSHFCTSTPKTSVRPTKESTPVEVIALAVALTVVLAAVLVSVGVKQWKKNRRALPSIESPDSQICKVGQPSVTTAVNEEDGKLMSHCIENEQNQLLPDCVPREIRTHEFIYFVLEVVPINRFKELARWLNVSEQDIDRAERDNRAFADAQYQMLKVWSNNAHGGGQNILPRPLLQEFVDRLKDMNLNGCAESIENKYCNEA